MYIVVASKYTTLEGYIALFNYMALRAMCKYSILLTLVVLEALMKLEDKPLGRKFTVVTDHKGLEYFKT